MGVLPAYMYVRCMHVESLGKPEEGIKSSWTGVTDGGELPHEY